MTNLQNRQNADGHWRCKRCRKFRPLVDFALTREQLPVAVCQLCKEKVERIDRRKRAAAQQAIAAASASAPAPLRPWTGGVNRQESWLIASRIPDLGWVAP